MSAHRHRATWRSLTFNRRYVDDGTANPDNPANLDATYLNNDYYLDSLDLTRVSVQDYREMRQFLEGAEPNEAYEGVRALNGVGRIVAPHAAGLEDMTWAMYEAFSVAACRVAAQALDPVGVLPFSFKRDTAPVTGVENVATVKALRFYARPGPGRPVVIGRVREGLVRPYSFQLIAFDPFAYDESETQYTFPGASGTPNNPGNLYSRPKIRVTFGGAGNAAFTIANATTGKTLVIDASTAAAAEVWVVDVARGKIYRASDSANRYSQRVSGFVSDQWLAPGANTVNLSNTTNVSSVRYDFRGAYA